jgi:hypothetical protein
VHGLQFCGYHTAHILQFIANVRHVALSKSVLSNVSDFVLARGALAGENEFGNDQIREKRAKDFAYVQFPNFPTQFV